MTTEF